MKKLIYTIAIAAAGAFMIPSVQAQLSLGRLGNAVKQGVQAFTLTDRQMADYVKESVEWMDNNNKVSDANSAYTKRLNRLTERLTEVEGLPLNFKVYEVSDINAFACPDGSVRVFSSLMDIMSDDELLGIIGHEIGHVAKHHSRKAFQNELLTGALKDGIASTGGVAAALTDSQVGQLGQALIGAKYSQKQEKEADDYGYEFLVSHGRNPWGMVMAFEKFLTLEGNGGAGSASYIQKMFSSHPDTKDRIKRLTKRAEKDGIARP